MPTYPQGKIFVGLFMGMIVFKEHISAGGSDKSWAFIHFFQLQLRCTYSYCALLTISHLYGAV
jgi:hypothetical protein